MAEYIDREAVLRDWPLCGEPADAYQFIQGFPASDVVERKPMAEDVEEFVARLRDFAVELRKAEDALLVRDAADAIEELSEERKTGKWIDYTDYGYVECPFCGADTDCADDESELHFCFSCGAKMEGVENYV